MTPRKFHSERDFYRVCEMLKAHNLLKDRPTPQHTLNSLFLKHIKKYKRKLLPLPILTADNVKISIENWSKESIINICEEYGNRLPNPLFLHLPIVIINYKKIDCLIDGGSRVGVWVNSNDIFGTHPVVILWCNK